MSLKISIIVPVYNSEKYLAISVASVLKQNFIDWELILINDGSTDSSLTICKDFEKLDARIKVYSQLNKGLGAALNYGIEYTTGDYVMFLDSDDTLDLDTLEKNVSFLKTYKCDFLQFPVHMNFSSDKNYEIKLQTKFYNNQDDFFDLWLVENLVSWIKCNKIIKSSVLKTVSFQENMIYEDNYFIVDLLNNVKNFFISDQGMYYYYLREGSLSNSKSTMNKEFDTLKVLCHILDNLKLYKHKDTYLSYLVRVVNVEKSLSYNFKQSSKRRFDYIKNISVVSILTSKLNSKDKIKLLLAQVKYT